MSFTIRAAVPTDLDELGRLWQERMEVYLKHEPRKQVQKDDWQTTLRATLSRPDAAVLVAERADGLIGYIVGWAWDQPPFTQPNQAGIVTELSVDGHCKQGGVGLALLQAVGEWFKARGIYSIEARVPQRQPIEQAFWRSVGATTYIDHFYMKLD